MTLGQARSQGGTKGCRELPNKNPVHPQINPVHPQINPFWPHFCPFSVICGSFAPPKFFLWLRACLGDMLHETYWENPMRIEAGLSIRSLQLHIAQQTLAHASVALVQALFVNLSQFYVCTRKCKYIQVLEQKFTQFFKVRLLSIHVL